MKPTPEQIKQIAIECGLRSFQQRIQAPFSNEDITEQINSFFTRAYELGWKNRGEIEPMRSEARKIVDTLPSATTQEHKNANIRG